ncbi:hypothetical protein ACIP69_26255 [Streptomyces hygroscopicus]|uniref:hypothetical protein n=1 Tax=Streptomyces hygroscopicus TaxID=1912 RepID=UPI0038204F32
MPDDLLAHTGTPDVGDPNTRVLRHPDVIVIAESDMDVEGALDPRTLLAAIEVVSRSNPDKDWVGKTPWRRCAQSVTETSWPGDNLSRSPIVLSHGAAGNYALPK